MPSGELIDDIEPTAVVVAQTSLLIAARRPRQACVSDADRQGR